MGFPKKPVTVGKRWNLAVGIDGKIGRLLVLTPGEIDMDEFDIGTAVFGDSTGFARIGVCE